MRITPLRKRRWTSWRLSSKPPFLLRFYYFSKPNEFTEGIEKRTDDNPFFAETRTFAQCVFGDLEKVKNSDKDPKWLVRNNLEKGKPFPKIYMTCGKQDFLLQLNKEFYNYLIQNGVTVEYVEDEGSHEWDFWNRAIKRVIDWLPLEQSGEGINSGNIGI